MSKRSVCLLLLSGMLQMTCFAGVPLTDMILYGIIYTKSGDQQVTGGLSGPIQLKINGATEPEDTVIASTDILISVEDGPLQFFVLRIPRFETGTQRQASDTFTVPGDEIHILYNGVEVNETERASILVTDSLEDIRFMSLNAPAFRDADENGLPDDWEIKFFAQLGQNPDAILNADGLRLLQAYVMGLDPRINNSSRMPYLLMEEDSSLTYYFRHSADVENVTYTVESTETITPADWQPMTGIVPETVGQEGDSVIVKVVIPTEETQPSLFLRLQFEVGTAP